MEETSIERYERPADTVPLNYVQEAGVVAMAELSEAEFGRRLQTLRQGQQRLSRLHKELMRPDVDYGVIPGTKKPSLLKPGAERLAQFYRLAAEFKADLRYGTGEGEPAIVVVTECRLHLGTLAGPVINTGLGATASSERRFARQQGDAFELLNTILKMSEKRAFVNAVLRATATSALYSQDLEDLPPQSASGTHQSPNAGRPAPAQPNPPPRLENPVESPPRAVCSEPGCGLILSEAEVKGSQQRKEAFGGGLFCEQHGKRLLAAWQAGGAVQHAAEAAERDQAEKALLLERMRAEKAGSPAE